MIGKIIGTVAKTMVSPKVKMVVDVMFYTSSAIKMVTELSRDWTRDYDIRMKTDAKIAEITKDEFHDYLVDNRDELLKNVLTDKEKAFLKTVAKKTAEAEAKAG